MNRTAPYTLDRVLPHGPGMILLDRLSGYGEDWAECEVLIRADSPFCDGQAVPGWIGIEYMAQTLCAWVGIQRLAAGRRVQVELLIGARRYRSAVSRFEPGARLRVRAELLVRDAEGVCVFACRIYRGDSLLAEADIKAYDAEDIEPYLKELEKELA